jgi:hypothetical protein
VSRQFSLAITIILVAGFFIYELGVTLNYRRYSDDVVEEMMYFPSGSLLNLASAGNETLVADFLWLRGIQYYGEHRRTDRSYPLAEHVFSTITELDPQFVGAYRFGAFVLGQDVGQPVAGINLIRKGMVENPGTWQLPFDLGFLYFIQLKDSRSAAHFFNFAARQEGAPALVKRFSAFAYRKAGKNEMAKALWEEISRSSDNEVMQETADFALKSIARDEIADSLTSRIERFRALRGRSPANLGELETAGLVAKVPDDPFGGTYFLDPGSGRVLSTSAVKEAAEHAQRYVERLVGRYRDQEGRYPQDLADLKASGLVDSLPRVPGTLVKYDPGEGAVKYMLDAGGKR